MSFFTELKRRNVFRVGIAYLIGSWLLAQIADLLIDNIGAPDWVMKTLFLVLAIGFFMSLFFAWAFEMTPEGVKRESKVDRSQSITRETGQKLNRTIMFVLVLALGYIAWDKLSEPAKPTVAASGEQRVIERSIAVLPFVNMSAEKENEYFSDGLSEELLNLLAKVDGLKVAARTSSFKFKNSEADISEIGERLNVATVLEGSVRKSGNQARITAQLIKVDDGFHLWSETYDRNLDNIFEVQDEIAKAIVDALKLPLLGHDAKPLTTTSAENFTAYDRYLLGRHNARQYSEQGFKRAIDYYLASLESDPSFAPAYSGLADGYIFLADYGDLPQGEALQLAQTAAEKSLSIDPDSPEAHTSMGLLLTTVGHERDAERHFLKALEINPNYVNALLFYRNSLNGQFRHIEAKRLIDRAMAVDPLSHAVRRAHAAQFITLLRFDDAVSEIQAFIAANPDDPMPYELWGNLFQKKGMPQNSIPMYRNAHRLRPGDIYMASQNTAAGLQLNDEKQAAYWLKEAQERGADGQWTQTAENLMLYATGNFEALLQQVDQLLESLPEDTTLLLHRSAALMNMDQPGAARETLQRTLGFRGYESGQKLTGDELTTVVQLANIFDSTGNMEQRDLLLESTSEVLQQLHRDEPRHDYIIFLGACVASIQNDLPGMLRELETAVEYGFRNHWELIRNPVFARWQDNDQFKAFHQDMLKTAARMRREYMANNPVEKPAVVTEVFN